MTYDHPELKKTQWKSVGSLPNNQQELDQLNRDPNLARMASYGAHFIDRVINEEKPDVYFAVQDIWGVDFAIEKNWEKYHTIRNLVLALGSEVGELQAEFRWMSDEETNNLDEAKKRSIEDEIADVAIFLFRLTDVLKIDIYQAVQEKIEKNSKRVTRGPEFTS